MPQTTDKSTCMMPSATPTDVELAEWAILPRDEQVRRYQEMFRHPDCNTFTTDTPDDILAAARQRDPHVATLPFAIVKVRHDPFT